MMSTKSKMNTKQKGIIALVAMAVLSVVVIIASNLLNKEIVTPSLELKDGYYKVDAPDFDGSGYKGMVSMEVAGGAITAVTWDLVNEAGEYKSQLSMDGKYVMTESNPKWHEQAEMLSAYVIENQSVDGLKVDADGKTDAIASVSIDISGFIDLLSDCMAEASK